MPTAATSLTRRTNPARLRFTAARLLPILGLFACWTNQSHGQEPLPSNLATSPVGVRQQRIERMVQELQEKFKSLRLAIQDKEPERAERLQQALNKAKGLL